MRLNRSLTPLLALGLCAGTFSSGAGAAWAQTSPTPPLIDDGQVSGGGVGADGVETVATNTTPGTKPGPGSGPKPAPAVTNAGGQTILRPPPDCRYRFWMTGPEMAAYAATFVVPMFPAPATGWQAHATDLDGAWYEPRCQFTSGSPDALEERARAFRLDNPPIWGATEPPPPPIPVEDLVEVVRDSQQLPSLVVSTNPDAQTVVGLRTWVWPTGGDFGPVTSRAESGPNWAQVTATPGRISVTSSDPGAELGGCATAPAWSPGADDDATDCFVTFRRSSAGRPGQAHTISVSMTWQVRLTTSDGRDELLASQQVASDVPVPVAQVQSVLR